MDHDFECPLLCLACQQNLVNKMKSSVCAFRVLQKNGICNFSLPSSSGILGFVQEAQRRRTSLQLLAGAKSLLANDLKLALIQE